MTETLTRPADPAPSAPEDFARPVTSPPVVLALFSVLAGLVAGALFLTPPPPGESSADVGFARDMSSHHAQAVAMAETIRDRTDEPELRVLAADIALTQQGQIGMMSAWLDSWGRTPSGSGPRMAWMGMTTTGLMPGMAPPEQVQALKTLPVERAEEEFLRLMVAHHAAGVGMATAGASLAEQPQVVALAQGIAAAQTAEIEYLQSLLAARGAAPAVVVEVGMDHGAAGHGGGPSVRDSVLLGVVTLGLLALLWLLTDAVAGRLGRRPSRLDGVTSVLVVSAVVIGAVHLVLTPAHAKESTAFGLFFLLTALTAVLGAALVLAGVWRTGARVVAGVSVVLLGTYVLFRLVPPPGTAAPEGIDAWGVVAVTAELLALVAAAVVLRRGARLAPMPSG